MADAEEKTNSCGTICLKYLLFIFNLFFWLAGGAVMAVGIWTLVDKSDYISLLSSSTYSAAAFILIGAGAVVVFTGILGCCATIREQRGLLIVFFVLLLLIFLLEITAGILAYVYYQECFPLCYQLNAELRADLKERMVQNYQQPGQEHITRAIDNLQQDLKCCGSNSSADWREGAWIHTSIASKRLVPDSCCKTPTEGCGVRDHPSNIYKVEGGCISKLEEFILQHLIILGSVGLGIAFIQASNSDIIPANIFTPICICCHFIGFNLQPSLSVTDCRDDFYLLLVSKFERRNILRKKIIIDTNTKKAFLLSALLSVWCYVVWFHECVTVTQDDSSICLGCRTVVLEMEI
uniref:CD151 molecule n=1 Tax=Cyprinus carpio TaxID=7962 RepID=A0A8C1S1F4_CYPCA